MSPTERTLKKLRDDCWMAQVVERWSPHGGAPMGGPCPVCKHQRFTGLRHDLFGFGDVLAVRTPGQTMVVQACSIGDSSRRVQKLMGQDARDAVILCLGARWYVEVWGWTKRRSKKLRKDGTRSTRQVACVQRTRIVADLSVPGGLRAYVFDEESPDELDVVHEYIENEVRTYPADPPAF